MARFSGHHPSLTQRSPITHPSQTHHSPITNPPPLTTNAVEEMQPHWIIEKRGVFIASERGEAHGPPDRRCSRGFQL